MFSTELQVPSVLLHVHMWMCLNCTRTVNCFCMDDLLCFLLSAGDRTMLDEAVLQNYCFCRQALHSCVNLSNSFGSHACMTI